MSNVKHRIFVGHPDRQNPETETFYILAENGDRFLTEDSNNLLIRQDG